MRIFARICLVAGFGALLPAAGAAAPPSPEQLEIWVKQLDAEDYALREEATRKLMEASEASIEALSECVASKSPEVAWRASEALQQIAIQGDEAALNRVVAALDKLSQSGKPGLTNIAQELRARQIKLRHDRAAAQVRSLGGRLAGGESMDPGFMVGGFIGGFDVMPAMEVMEVAGGDVPLEIIDEVRAVDVLREAEAAAPAEAPPERPLVLKALGAALDRLSDLLPVEIKDEPPKFFEEIDPPPPAIAAPPKIAVIEPPPPALEPPVPEPPQAPALDATPAEEPAPPAAEAPLAEPGAEGEIAIDGGEVVIADAIALDAGFAGPIFGGGFFIDEGVSSDESGGLSTALALGQDWRGGDDGLKGLRDLPSIYSVAIENAKLTDAALEHLAALPNLQQLSIQGTKFSAAALAKLRERRPAARVTARGEAMLGIHADLEGSCVLTSIYHGSGAFEAGLKAGDEIVAIDGYKVRDFSDLTIAVYTHAPGDKLKVEYLREGKQHAVDVVLKSRSVVERRSEP